MNVAEWLTDANDVPSDRIADYMQALYEASAAEARRLGWEPTHNTRLPADGYVVVAEARGVEAGWEMATRYGLVGQREAGTNYPYPEVMSWPQTGCDEMTGRRDGDAWIALFGSDGYARNPDEFPYWVAVGYAPPSLRWANGSYRRPPYLGMAPEDAPKDSRFELRLSTDEKAWVLANGGAGRVRELIQTAREQDDPPTDARMGRGRATGRRDVGRWT